MVSQWEGMQDSFQDLPPCDVFLRHRKRKRGALSRGYMRESDNLDILVSVVMLFVTVCAGSPVKPDLFLHFIYFV